MPIDNDLSKLESIILKVRRLIRNPSEEQIADDDIIDYVNTFILYDFPEHLRQSYLRTTLTFYTEPYVDTYSTDSFNDDDPLYNFKNKYITTHGPVYIAGKQATFTQSREQFYNIYPRISSRANIGTGNGVTVDFWGGIGTYPILQNSVIVSTVNIHQAPVVAPDNGLGEFTGPVNPLSSVSYATGQIYVSFTVAPATGETVWAAAVPYAAGQPISILFFEDKFVVRPVPDQTYKVEVTTYKRPTEFISTDSTQIPELSEWWEYIAIGAGIKLLQDRLDGEGVNMLMPMFKEQEILIGRRKIIQNAGKRTPTIYSGVE